MVTLEWEHIWARYARSWALRDAGLRAEAGQTVCLIGPAGGGKTTLLRVASGGLRPASGRVWLNGAPQRGRGSLLCPWETLRPWRTVSACIARRAARAGMRGRALDRRIKLALRAWDLEPSRDVRAGTLSGSLLQRLRLAAQWAAPAPAWLLDNPTALLEPHWRDAFPSLLSEWCSRDGGVAVWATGQPDEGATADVAAILVAGRVASSGEPARLCRAAGAEQIVVRTVDDDAAEERLRSGVHLEAERCSEGLRLRVRRADDVLASVVSAVGPALETVWVRRPTLRDAVAHYAAIPPPPDAPSRPPVDRPDRPRS